MTGPLRASGATVFRRASVGFLALLLFLPATVLGGGARVDFPEAVSRAMTNNPFLSAAGEEWAAAKKDTEAARGYYLPSLTFEERFVRTNIPSEAFAFKINQERMLLSDFASVDNFNKPSPINEYMTTFTVEQALFAPKVYLGHRMAGHEAYAKGLELRAKVFLASAESSRVTAENRLALAQRGLALAMGEKSGSEVDAAAALPPLPDEGSLEDRIAVALAGRADLRAFSLRVENAAANVALQRSDYLPTVGVMGAWQMDGQEGVFSPDNHAWKVGMGLKWNLFDGFRREAAVARSYAESGKAKAYYRGGRDARGDRSVRRRRRGGRDAAHQGAVREPAGPDGRPAGRPVGPQRRPRGSREGGERLAAVPRRTPVRLGYALDLGPARRIGGEMRKGIGRTKTRMRSVAGLAAGLLLVAGGAGLLARGRGKNKPETAEG